MVASEKIVRNKILLADDASEHSRAAVKMLGEMKATTKQVTALRVFTPLQSAEHAVFQAQLDETKKLLKRRGLKVETDLVLGYPAEKIIEYADNFNPYMIVMGAKGLRSTMGILLGGVVQQVVEYANWPVLVVRAPYKGLKKALLVTDGSEYSQIASEFVTKFPFPKSIDLRVIHVIPPITYSTIADPLASGTPISSAHIPYIEEAMRRADETEGQKLIDTTLNQLSKAGLKAMGVLRRGDAATEIIAYAKEQDINLIIAGSRGLSQIKSLLIGSVTRKLVHYSDCSVLIVKGENNNKG